MSSILFSHLRRQFIIAALISTASTFMPLAAGKREAAAIEPMPETNTKGIISQIKIEPPYTISESELKSLTGIREGALISRRDLKKGIKLLYLKGNFSDISVDAREVNEKITLSFRFTLRERVGKISFSGNKGISRRYLEDILTIAEWDELNLKLHERQALTIKEFYRKNGYFQCKVGYEFLRVPGRKDVDIKYVIQEGGRANLSQIFLTGNKAFSEQQLLGRLSLKVGAPYEEDRVTAAIKRVEGLYRKSGYREARVGLKSSYVPKNNSVEIAVDIEEGGHKDREKKLKIRDITFKGNTAIDSKTLRRQMLTPRIFSEDTLAADMDAIEFLYRKNGYLSARIAEKAIRYSEDGSQIMIEMTIEEGPKTLIKGMEVAGNFAIGKDELLSKSGLRVNAPLDLWAVDEGIVKMSSLYFQKGYIYAKVSCKKEFSGDRTGVTLKYTVAEGIPVKIGKIVIRGNDFTEDKVIRRGLLIKTGDIYNPESVFKSRQRIYRLGFLSSVRINPVEEEVVEGEKSLLISVKEKKAGAFEFGAGYGTEERFRGFAEISHRNLFGTGASARLRGDVSQLQNSYTLGFNKPWLFDLPVDGRLSLLDQVMRRPSYSLEKYAAIAGLDKDITEFIKGSLQYEYEISRLFNVGEGAKVSPDDEGTLDIGTISPIISRDSRDNPFNPRAGSANSIKLDYSAGMATSSEVKFVRYILQSSWYIPVSKRVVWGLSARGGWAEASGKTKEIPISKRFFLGGRTTVRGFELDSIGPKGTDGSPTGGDVYLNLNTELRFPIYRSFGGLVFVDAGNVWLKKDPVNIADLRPSSGIGLRYLTPIGPLSLDAGWKLDREKGESEWEWHFTIGNVF